MENDEIECNALRITQVLVNLIANEVDAIGKFEKQWIEVSRYNIDDQIQIKITDCGLGIPRDVREKLMTPFFTSKDKGQGTRKRIWLKYF